MTADEEARETERKLAANKRFRETTGGNCTGLSILDYFAGQALVMLMSGDRGGDIEDFARYAYTYAAAMLAEKTRREEPK